MNRRPLEKDSAGDQVVAEERELLGGCRGCSDAIGAAGLPRRVRGG